MKKLVACAALCLLAANWAAAEQKATAEEAKILLEKAVVLVKAEGDTKALAMFNDPKGGFQYRDLYVFCFGPDNKVTANVDQSMIGKDEKDLKDADGKPIGAEMMKVAASGEGKVEYRWKNPVSQKVETKVSYLRKAGSQVCGVGATSKPSGAWLSCEGRASPHPGRG